MKGGPTKLIMELGKCSYEEAKRVLGLYSEKELPPIIKTKKKEFKIEKEWELIKDGKEHPALIPFLKKRRFELDLVIREGCWIATEGRYKHRLIMPISFQGRVVAIQARDMTYRAKIPYLNSDSLLDYIYWIDEWAGGKLVITEGIFDSWRIGKGVSVALFSVNFTQNQIRQIVKLNVKEVLIAFDQDAKRKAIELKQELEPYFPVRILKIIEDPASMSGAHISRLIGKERDDVKLRKYSSESTGNSLHSHKDHKQGSNKIFKSVRLRRPVSRGILSLHESKGVLF